MANFLDYRCPKCGGMDDIDVAATVWVRLTMDGTDADATDDGSHEYDRNSSAHCAACDFSGQLETFDPDPKQLTMHEALQHALTALNTAPRFPVPALLSDSYRIAALCEAAIKETRGHE